jgi:hypothetical protein
MILITVFWLFKAIVFLFILASFLAYYRADASVKTRHTPSQINDLDQSSLLFQKTPLLSVSVATALKEKNNFASSFFQ